MKPGEISWIFRKYGYANCRSAYWGGQDHGHISVPPLEGDWLPEQVDLMVKTFAAWLELAHEEAGTVIKEVEKRGVEL